MTRLEQRVLDYMREYAFPSWTASGVIAAYFLESAVTDEVFRRRTREVGQALKKLSMCGYLECDNWPRPGYRMKGS